MYVWSRYLISETTDPMFIFLLIEGYSTYIDLNVWDRKTSSTEHKASSINCDLLNS